MEIQYCLTENRWSNILTKPKQREGFRPVRAEFMNCPVNYEDKVNDGELDEILNGFDKAPTVDRHITGVSSHLLHGSSLQADMAATQGCVGE